MEHHEGALKGLRKRVGRGHGGGHGLIAFHGQQHGPAGGGTECAGVPIGGDGQHRAGCKPDELLGDSAHHDGSGALISFGPTTMRPASYWRATSTSICATAPWRISE